jgi:hypothetical protein
MERIEQAIKVKKHTKQALDASEELWATLGPQGDADPIQLDKMETEARERFSDTPEVMKLTIGMLRERKAGVDASRREREEQTTGALWARASEGASLRDLTAMPEFLAAPGRLQAQLVDYMNNRAYTAEARAAARAARAESEEGRAFTRENRRQQQIERAGWAKYWELSDPSKLKDMNDNQLNMLRGELGDDHVNRLFDQKRKQSAGADKVHAATIDDDLFKTTANAAGLPAYDAKSEADKAMLGQLKNAVETAIDVEQQQTGKPITRDRKEQIMRGIVDQRVMLDTWFKDPERIAAVVRPEDRAKAYVPIAQIPPRRLGSVLNYLRGMAPQLQGWTDAQLRQRYEDRIQRAYAHQVLGASAGEIAAILEGKD